jgi:hypothetical protein
MNNTALNGYDLEKIKEVVNIKPGYQAQWRRNSKTACLDDKAMICTLPGVLCMGLICTLIVFVSIVVIG